MRRLIPHLHPLLCLAAFLSSAFQAFGVYNVHAQSAITEGGVIGLVLVIHHWLHISPAFSGFVLNGLCYLVGFKTLGKEFLGYSAVGALGFSIGYRFFEQSPPLWPWLCGMPLAAVLLGALFVGIGTGICVWAGGAANGDDALAMSFSKLLRLDIRWVYLFTDLSVLLLSLTYIPLHRILYSIITVVLSGQIIGLLQRLPKPVSLQKSE